MATRQKTAVIRYLQKLPDNLPLGIIICRVLSLPLNRRWGVESKFGARLDSMADFVFVFVVGYKLFPWLKLPATLWMMIGLIALVKTANAVSSYVVNHRIEFLHTKANKLTGFLLFVGVMAVGQSYFILVAWIVACLALFAAIQEGHYIRSK